jgi:hypothetical protein
VKRAILEVANPATPLRQPIDGATSPHKDRGAIAPLALSTLSKPMKQNVLTVICYRLRDAEFEKKFIFKSVRTLLGIKIRYGRVLFYPENTITNSIMGNNFLEDDELRSYHFLFI